VSVDEQSRPGGLWATLANRDFRLLITSNFLWWQVLFMEQLVVGWLVLELTNSAWEVALVGFYRMAPLLVIGFFTGPITDRVGRRRIIILSELASIASLLVILSLVWTDQIAFWHLASTALVLGVSWSLSWTARRSILPDLVGRARTTDAMLLDNLSQSISRVAGPFVAGWLVAVYGISGGYIVVCVVSVLSLSVVWGMSKPPARPKVEAPSSWRLMVEGLRYIRHSQPIIGTLLITVAMNFLTFPYMSMLPIFARDILGQGPLGLGIMGAANGAGSLVGVLLVNQARKRISSGWIFAGGSVILASSVTLFAASRNFHLSVALLLLGGVGHACFSVMQSTIVLLAASDEMRSRAMGSILLAIGGGPPGRLQVGALSEIFGAPLAVGGSAGIAVVVVLVITALLPGYRSRLAEPPSDRPART